MANTHLSKIPKELNMTKTQYLVLSIVPLFLYSALAASEEPFESSQKTIEHCLPVKPLPSKLTLDDAKTLLKANYSPSWCQLISQLGYLWNDPTSSSLSQSAQMEVGMTENRRVLQSAAKECLQSNLNLEISLKNRIIAYVNHQHQCETTGVKEACDRARGLAFNILYSDLAGKDALRMKVRLKRIVEKSKGCVKMEEITNYCQQIGMRTTVCEKL
jgi:ribosomal protein L20A (L18A)